MNYDKDNLYDSFEVKQFITILLIKYIISQDCSSIGWAQLVRVRIFFLVMSSIETPWYAPYFVSK